MDPLEARSDIRSHFIAAPPAAVFAAMSQATRVARWWGPAGFRNTIHAFEFRDGGAYELTMHGPDGQDWPCHWRFVRIEPGVSLEAEHGNPDGSSHHFVLSLRLQAQGQGTLVHWRQSFAGAAELQAVEHVVRVANQQNLERLAAEVLHGESSA
jgi:uncharacterized protein YndB with AHSA1/START domain